MFKSQKGTNSHFVWSVGLFVFPFLIYWLSSFGLRADVSSVYKYAIVTFSLIAGALFAINRKAVFTLIRVSSSELKLLFFITILFSIIRFLALDNLPPTTDEYLHLFEAKKEVLPEGVLYEVLAYPRFKILTDIVALLFGWIKDSVVLARVPGVVSSTVFTFLFWFKLKKYDRTIAILACTIFAVSPWVTMLSVTVREYIFLVGLHFILGISLFESANAFLEKRYTRKRLAFDSAILFFLILYLYKIDIYSSAKSLLINYPIAFVYLVFNLFSDYVNRIKLKKWVYISAAVAVFILPMVIVSSGLVSQSLLPGAGLGLAYKSFWIEYLFLNGSHGTFIYFGVFLMLGIIMTVAGVRKDGLKGIHSFSLLAFIMILYGYTFFFGRYTRARYITLIIPWLTILAAYGLALTRNLLSGVSGKSIGYVLMLILFINWFSVNSSVLSSAMKSGNAPITGEFHEYVWPVSNELCTKENEGKVIVSTLPYAFDFFCDGHIKEVVFFPFRSEEPEAALLEILGTSKSGYFIIDDRRVMNLKQDPHDLSIDLGEVVLSLYMRIGPYNIYRFEF